MIKTDDQYNRIPPSSPDAEACTIASCILDHKLIAEVSQIIGPESFFSEDNQILFQVLQAMDAAGTPIDAVTLRDELARRKVLEDVGGVPYIASLLDRVPSSANGMQYARIVREHALRRGMIAAANQMLADAYDTPHEKADALVDRAESRIANLVGNRPATTLAKADQFVMEVYEKAVDPTVANGLPTGFKELDDFFRLRDGEVTVVAARPRIGKSALASDFTMHLAIDQGLPGAIFSLEMSKQQLAQRMMCSRGEVDSWRVMHKTLDAQERGRLAQYAAVVNESPIWFDDNGMCTLNDIRATCRKLKQKEGLRYVVVDYLQLMDGEGEKREQIVARISRGLKALGMELQIPMIVLSQLNRNSEHRDGHKPRLADLRESGAIEQDADNVLLLHREDEYHLGEDGYEPTNTAEVIVAKQRSGRTGIVKLVFDGRYTKFRNLAHTPDAPPF